MQQINEREQWQNWELKADMGLLDSLLLKSQLYCVVQTAHANAAIRSSDGNAWLRCIAFCSTLDSAYEVARNAHDTGDKMETRILQSGKCALISQSKRSRGDLDKMLEDQKKANRIYDNHVAERTKTMARKSPEESETLVENAPSSPLESFSLVLPLPLPPAEIAALASESASACTPISMDFGKPQEVFMQKYFAIGVIQDYDKELKEPVVIPLASAESMEALQEIVKPMSNNIDLIHVDIFCGTLLEWLPLNNPKSTKVFHKHPLRQALEEKIKWIHEPSITSAPSVSVSDSLPSATPNTTSPMILTS
jgi:hypothetical protein